MPRTMPFMPRLPKNPTLQQRVDGYESYVNVLKPGFLPKLPADMPPAERMKIYKSHMKEWRSYQRVKWTIIWSAFAALVLIVGGIFLLVRYV